YGLSGPRPGPLPGVVPADPPRARCLRCAAIVRALVLPDRPSTAHRRPATRLSGAGNAARRATARSDARTCEGFGVRAGPVGAAARWALGRRAARPRARAGRGRER